MTGAVLMLVNILTLLSIADVSFVDSAIQGSLGKFLGTFGAIRRVRIPDLLNQMCDQSQGSDEMLRDACYGCLYRASVLPQGYSMLEVMSTCADTYLNGTEYGHCQDYLREVTSEPNGRSPMLIYCSFLECIRQVNENNSDIDVRRAPLRGVARQIEHQRRPFKFLKVLARRSVCIIKESVTTTTTTEITPGSIDPRD